MATHKIFTYGTLRKGHYNHPILEKSTYLGKAQTNPAFTMLNLGAYPGIVHQGRTPIIGEVYEVDDQTLKRLDRLESHPNFYERVPLEVTLENDTVAVEGYVLPAKWLDDRAAIIDSGDWATQEQI